MCMCEHVDMICINIHMWYSSYDDSETKTGMWIYENVNMM
jgi:hypothetical protein